MSMSSTPYIVSLGGSLIVPDQIDVVFLQKFKSLIERHVAKGKRFIIITGGGKVCRRYQSALTDLREDATIDDVDWVGIYATHMNGQLMRSVFKDLVHAELLTDPSQIDFKDAPVVIGAGWKPGWSTDYVMIDVAHRTDSTHVINLSNVEYVYDSDPRENPNAQKYEDLTWQQYRGFIPEEWSPGLSTPFDPIASAKAQEYGIEVAIIKGQNLESFENYLNGKPFEGTRITP